MTRPEYDGVVEGVRYKPDGEVDWVRLYLRRGAAFSDHVILPRQKVVELIKSGKKLVAGQRIPYMAGTFEVTRPLRILQQDGKELLLSGGVQTEHDYLEGVPII